MTLRPLFDHCWGLPLAAEADGAADGESVATPSEPPLSLATSSSPCGGRRRAARALKRAWLRSWPARAAD